MTSDGQGFVVWLMGLSGAGKTTVGDLLAARLKREGLAVQRLDGDAVRRDLSRDLGFSREDREEHLRRVAYVARVLSANGIVAVASFITPYRATRQRLRREIRDLVEVYVKCPLKICIERDVKGLYERAIAGEIDDFTGISAPFEEPEDPDVVVASHNETPAESVEKVMTYLRQTGRLLETTRERRPVLLPTSLLEECFGPEAAGWAPERLSAHVERRLRAGGDQEPFEGTLTPEQEEAIRRRLIALGYLED